MKRVSNAVLLVVTAVVVKVVLPDVIVGLVQEVVLVKKYFVILVTCVRDVSKLQATCIN